MKISFGTKQENIDKDGVTHVTLDNTSPNAKIDYATGNAEPLFAKKKVETTVATTEAVTETTVNQEEYRTVYVAKKREVGCVLVCERKYAIEYKLGKCCGNDRSSGEKLRETA